MEFFGSLIENFSKPILEKFFLYIIDSLNAISNFPQLFFVILNKSFQDTLIYIAGHSTLEHFQIILNVFMAKLSLSDSDPSDISFYFFISFIETALYDLSFFDKLAKMTKNTFKKEINQIEIEQKRSHLLSWVLSYDIFSRLCELSASDTFYLYEQILRKLQSKVFNRVRNEDDLSNNILQETNAFFENSSDQINHFAFQLYELGGFIEHLFLLLISDALKIQIRKEFLEA
jgi:hypothetical protein